MQTRIVHTDLVSLRSRLASVAAAITVVMLVATGSAATNDGMISSASVERAGLAVEWFTQIEIGASGQLVDLDMNISYFGAPIPVEEDNPRKASGDDDKKRKMKMVPENMTMFSFLIEYEGHVERISQRDFDAFGNVLGVDGAEKQANLRKEIITAELKGKGKENVEVKITKLILPESSIYALSSDGIITAIDADNGQIKWKAKIGERRLPSIGLAASSNYVAAINGSSIYCLNAKNGKILWMKRCSTAPSASPAVSNKFVYVPLFNGRVQVFPIETHGVGTVAFVSSGIPLARPLITENTVSWPTDKGFYTVAPKGEVQSATYRLRSSDAIVASGAYKGGLLFVVSVDGFVYAINEKSGSLIWEFSTGQRLSESPVVLDNYVYVITDEQNMFKVEARSGRLAEGWETPINGVNKYVGASEEKMYVLDQVGQVKVIDPKTGAQLGAVPGAVLDVVLPNSLSDRLYVGNRRGMIQCLHEVGRRYPYFHSPEFADADTKAKSAKDSDDPFKTKDADAADDNMGDDNDPFAAQDKDDDDTKDKGDDDDPFGGGGDDAMDEGDDDDPFGGGEDDDSVDQPKNESDDEGDEKAEAEEDEDDPFGGGTP